jgi:hypothetical protein
MVDLNYVRYSDSIEQMQPDEAELTELIIACMGHPNRKVFEKHRHAVRDAHAKSHGILRFFSGTTGVSPTERRVHTALTRTWRPTL